MKYRLYRNLHKGCFSVQQYTKGVGYRVIAHISHGYILHNCTFKVYSSGREKVLRDKQKNVHAYIQFESYSMGIDSITDEQPYYNPYKFDSFVSSKTMQTLTTTKQLQILNNQIYIAL
jgi:hypothetical protein